MSLTFHFSTPRDLLAKLSRDLQRLENATSSHKIENIADCLFDFANTAYSLKDWLKENTNDMFPRADVETYLQNEPALTACRDICNANKHYRITNYTPKTKDVFISSSDSTVQSELDHSSSGFELESTISPTFKVKVRLEDGTKFEVVDLARKAVTAWNDFMKRHGL